MGEEIKFENPTDLLEKVKSHGGNVFETLYYWQSFDRDNNIRILEDVIEYVERNNQKVFEITGEGLTNIPDSAVPFALPRNVKLNAKSVRWFHETTLEALNEELAWQRTAKSPCLLGEDGKHSLEAAKNQEAEEQMDEKSRLSMWDIYKMSMAIARETMLRHMDESEMKHKQAEETEGVSKAKESILAHYATGDVHKFTQIDGWLLGEDGGDDIMTPDEDGDWLASGKTLELRRSLADLAARIFIHEGTEPKDAARLIKKMLNWLERDPDLFTWNKKEIEG